MPRSRTGAAVGLVSVVGFTPDMFYAPIAGRLLDRSPGLAGHQHNFLLLAGIAIVGAAAVLLLTRLAHTGPQAHEAKDPEQPGVPDAEI